MVFAHENPFNILMGPILSSFGEKRGLGLRLCLVSCMSCVDFITMNARDHGFKKKKKSSWRMRIMSTYSREGLLFLIIPYVIAMCLFIQRGHAPFP